MLKEIRQGMAFTIVTLVLLGGAYNVLLWAIGQLAFRSQAEGSLIRRQDGTIVGSSLIGQRFTRAEYFHPRPSAVDYNAASTGASNYGPSNPDHLKAVRERIDAIVRSDRIEANQIPSEMVTASASGVDPDIPPHAAELQAARVAASREVEVRHVRDLIQAHTQTPAFGFYGRARVNVLELNLALDSRFGPPSPVPVATDGH